MCFFVALNANYGDVGIGQQFHRGRQHSEPCAQNRHEHGSTGERDAIGGGQRRGHFARTGRNLPRRLCDNYE